MKKRFPTKKWMPVLCVAVMAVALAVFIVATGSTEAAPDMPYPQFRKHLAQNEVVSASFSNQTIQFTLATGEAYQTDHPMTATIREEILLSGAKMEANSQLTLSRGAELSCLLVLVGGLLFYLSKQKKGKVGNSYTAVGFEQTKSGISFSSVAGQPEAIDGLQDIVAYLKDPGKYRAIGARMPKGVLLYGPPGTGKTLMARAMAGEAGVPFYAASGSDFVQMYVGVGAKRIRELFAKAKESKRCVVFIDEIDAIGKKRSDGQDSERDQTLNALLTQMSGFDESSDIVVLAATNRLDTLDEALLRPGRFDRQIQVGLPDKRARAQILSVLSQKMNLSQQVDLIHWAEHTTGFSGAALESMLNEAAIRSIRSGDSVITNETMEQAFLAVIAGDDRKDFYLDPSDRRRCAVHEAGHVVAAMQLLPEEPIKRVSIIPSTKGAGGYVLRELKERMETKDLIRKNIMVLYAGRVAEELFLGEEQVSIGASNDLEKATSLIYAMAGRYGMDGEAGYLVYERQTDTLTDIAKKLSGELYTQTRSLVKESLNRVEQISELLLTHESMNGQELDEHLKSA